MRKGLWLVFLTSPLLAAEPVYHWVDRHGVSHYSDTPQPAATRIDLAEPLLLGTGPMAVQTSAASKAVPTLPTPSHQLQLVSPEPEATIRDNQGQVRIAARLTPAITTPFTLKVWLDGSLIASLENALALQLQNVDRGAHRLHLDVVSPDGTILAKTIESRFYLHRARIGSQPKATPRQ